MDEYPATKRTIDLDRGVFIVRYSFAEDEAFPPKINIRPTSDNTEVIDSILHPDEAEAVLWHPGAALVVRALEAGQLFVEVTPTRANGSTAATVNVESLRHGKPAVDLVMRAAPGARAGAQDLRVIAHVARQGDIVAGANEWIGGPAAPSRIEGLAIEWPGQPREIALRYGVKMIDAGGTRSDSMAELGGFAGTRGKGQPLVGIMLELSGPSAPRYEFAVDAIFLGSPARHAAGQRVVLTSSGLEPLVGLKLNIRTVIQTVERRESSSPRLTKKPFEGRVRVFRGRGE